MRVSFDWHVAVDCTGPTVMFPVTGWPAELKGALALNPDRSYSIELSRYGLGMPPWTLSWQGRLGGPLTQTRGGTAELRVGGLHSLRAIFHEPNNEIVLNVDVDESGCRLNPEPQLHRGKTAYTVYNGDPRDDFRYELCPAIRTVSATCEAR
jgi:hypothetical protein